jgi:hypothetical protein
MSQTVQVRIRVAVWPDGDYVAYGALNSDAAVASIHSDMLDAGPDGEFIVWVTAEIPMPPPEVAGEVER